MLVYKVCISQATCLLLLAAAYFCANSEFAAGAGLVDPMKHNIGQVTQKSWSGKVEKFRSSDVFLVLFYRTKCAECKDLINGEYERVAKTLKGMVHVLAANCDTEEKLCKDNGVTKVPKIIIFPTFPMPSLPYQGPLTVEGITRALRPFIPSQVKSVLSEKDLDAFINGIAQIPKVLILSDKQDAPSMLVKSLSNAFKDKLHFVFLPSKKFPEAVTKYKVRNFPHLMVVRKGKKDEVYKGDMNFSALFDWLNVFSETFVIGGGFTDEAGSTSNKAETHPWRLERIPELTNLSNMDLCFKKSIRHLCVIFVKRGNELLTEELHLMEELKSEYEGGAKGLDFRFMWMNLDVEKEFDALFEINKLPSVVVINPHMKVRYCKLEEDLPVTNSNIRPLLDRIIERNERLKIIPQSKMPKFKYRAVVGVEDRGKKKDEL